MTLITSSFVTSLLMATSADAAVVNGLIAYSCETGAPGTHQQNICLIDPAAPILAATRKQITFEGVNGLPSWSPDGKFLAYTNFKEVNGAPSFRIFVMDIKSRSTNFIADGVAPAWSP